MQVPYLDLGAQYRALKTEIDAAVIGVLDSTQFILGPEVAAFEREFAACAGVPECVALNTGTSALHLALLACGIGKGDEVITVPFTFVATVAAIEYAGARPVLVDVEPEHLTMDPERRLPRGQRRSCLSTSSGIRPAWTRSGPWRSGMACG